MARRSSHVAALTRIERAIVIATESIGDDPARIARLAAIVWSIADRMDSIPDEEALETTLLSDNWVGRIQALCPRAKDLTDLEERRC